MAASEKTQSRAALKALSLFGVLALAKACMIAGRELPDSWVEICALFWDDAAVALIFAAFEWTTRSRPALSRTMYIALVCYAAINVPIARLTTSPLTVQMFRATGSALWDSIAHHLTMTNAGLILGVLASAVVLPRVARRMPERVWRPVGVAGLVLTFAGLAASGGALKGGNAFSTLLSSSLPRVQARSIQADWRVPVARGPLSDPALERFRNAARGRNVVLIALESTGAQYLKPYGAEIDPMPNLTRLAERSILFENAYAVYPESIKGLFSVLCSRYPAFDTAPEDYERVGTASLAEAARNAGYRTGLFHSGRFMYLGMRSIINNRGFEAMEDAGHIGGNHNSSFGVDEPSTVRRMLEWIDGIEGDEPFCLMYLPIAGHHPYETAGEGPFAGNDERTRYLNSLHYGDAALGELLEGLKRRGKDTNTVFVIYGDHGEAFGQHDGNFGHTFFLYEENVRVPLLIAAPGLIEKPLRVRNIASLIDVAPTVADLAGFRQPPEWQGISLLEDEARTALFFTDYSRPLVGLRDGQWKAIFEIGSTKARIFDLAQSKDEAVNLAATHPYLRDYRSRLESWAAAQKSLLKP